MLNFRTDAVSIYGKWQHLHELKTGPSLCAPILQLCCLQLPLAQDLHKEAYQLDPRGYTLRFRIITRF